MTRPRTWPRWSLAGEELALAKYVQPEAVADLVHLPGPSGAGVVGRLEAIYTALAEVKIQYAYPAASDDPDRQVIRPPEQVLWAPRHATCLDLAITLAAAGLKAHLHPIIILVDGPAAGMPGHALVGFWTGDDEHYPRSETRGLWPAPPEHLGDLVRARVAEGRPLLVVDPVGFSVALLSVAEDPHVVGRAGVDFPHGFMSAVSGCG